MDIYNIPAKRLLSDLKTKDEIGWVKNGQKMALKLFNRAEKLIPAYKCFLKENNYKSKTLKSFKDFSKIPIIDKNNYLRKFPREKLCWGGKFNNKRWVISTTSGSTGEPYYFPRTSIQDDMYAKTAELYLINNFNIDKKTTLYIDGFAMGAWIGGLFTYQAIKQISEKGKYALSIITPGIFKKEIINAVKHLGDNFDQIIIGGYPPLIKDTIDDGIRAGLKWKDYPIGFIFSAEGFSETFRDYIICKTGLKDIYTSTLNHYGTVDLGTMAHETPIAILIRRILSNKPDLLEKYFKRCHHLPTLAQYLPEYFYFEELDGRLICSSNSGVPLVRYDLKDIGGIYLFSEMINKLKIDGIDILKEAKNVGISDTVWKLPFVYVHERSDFIVKLYGANIYPNTIRKALQKEKLNNFLTGKFCMEIKYDASQTQYLEIHCELKEGKNNTLKLNSLVQENVTQALLTENSEFRSNYKESPDKQTPKIVFWKYEHPDYFCPGVKQKWVKKNKYE